MGGADRRIGKSSWEVNFTSFYRHATSRQQLSSTVLDSTRQFRARRPGSRQGRRDRPWGIGGRDMRRQFAWLFMLLAVSGVAFAAPEGFVPTAAKFAVLDVNRVDSV